MKNENFIELLKQYRHEEIETVNVTFIWGNKLKLTLECIAFDIDSCVYKEGLWYFEFTNEDIISLEINL